MTQIGRAEFARILAERTGLRIRKAEDVLDVLFGPRRWETGPGAVQGPGLIVEHVLAGDVVRISGFGSFEPVLNTETGRIRVGWKPGAATVDAAAAAPLVVALDIPAPMPEEDR